ncbi:Holliday junction DNA helicase RuvA [Natronobacillus azotifigens]|uniref:Holliday junction branch migration complex subunit RuvA n=1 Tax=Natronobacillus azotifigens TaxID=472978 RepID=A0A9J6R9W1_9BACI|nr:Holliday junction branch migration protein RuvA [Natronobacillus azotifigens]MCZ0702373.1 Holliday junction branch migration protein RuvA [Natronobacillus azotifigens]
MIAYIHGKLESVTDLVVIIEVNGVGYEIICANPLKFQHKLGEIVKIHTYHHVREDAQILYGFEKIDEKTLFSQILNVSGIGPKGALAIVGNAGVEEFTLAIEEENEKFLTGFPGVGKKTARQMILDLKGKLPFVITQTANDQGQTVSSPTTITKEVTEAIEALKSLGYSDRELKAITPALKQENTKSIDELIRKGLALLMQ